MSNGAGRTERYDSKAEEVRNSRGIKERHGRKAIPHDRRGRLSRALETFSIACKTGHQQADGRAATVRVLRGGNFAIPRQSARKPRRVL